ncbi:MAPEG family protein [Roseofilum casamattae]|uniref:MAPEG family protein n=1 Tax=Roseofilum casamattae BLCC-M143 TaxID=3022442 RepID=A0ABT7BWQ1_9CYAN|nr:MAPEG family protein [Roseofilum casamattae]MDJ1183632.1 MAPEG family protein [Roseofilum casamattae BLCC-M143]
MMLPFPVPMMLLGAIAIATFLIYLPYLLVAYARFQGGMAYLEKPRAMDESLPGYAQRANWAHKNSFEAFIIFSAAAGMAYATGVESTLAGWAALLFLVARSLYSVFYILNIPLGRALMFGTGSLCSFTLFSLSLLQASSAIA